MSRRTTPPAEPNARGALHPARAAASARAAEPRPDGGYPDTAHTETSHSSQNQNHGHTDAARDEAGRPDHNHAGPSRTGAPAPAARADSSDLAISQHAGVEPHGVDEPLVQPITEEDAPRRGQVPGGRTRTGAGPARSLAAGAALIAGVTVLSRLVGFLRTLVFSHTVGSNNLADAYNSANQIPNTVFDIVAGGALASVAVPLLAGPFARRDRTAASKIVSPLLTWSIAVLLPLSLLGMACAGLLGDLIAGPSHDIPGYAQTVSDFLTLFLPQIPLYAVAVVLSATLQADRRFLAPALAPLLSSLVVVCTYLLFGQTDPRAAGDLSELDPRARLILGLGTTLGVAMLVLALLPAVRRTGLRLRPTFRFPPGLARRAGALAVAGIATLVAQNLATLGVVLLTNYRAVSGALAVYNFSWAVYVLPYAVLAVPIATTAFTDLSARAETGDHAGYRDAVASTTRAVLIAACGGAALLMATAWPMAYLFIERNVPGDPPQSSMAYGLLAFAPGLLGYAAIAHLGRVLYAAGRGRAAAGATVTGWLAVLAVDCALIFALPKSDAVTALGLGNTIGMTVAGAALLTAVRRQIGRGVFAGLPRAFAVSVLAAAVAGSVGWLVAILIGPLSPTLAMAEAVLCALVALCLYAGGLLLFDDGDLRPTLANITARLRARIRPGGSR
ncbi:MAG TPA: lipid II flippase MurJ [Actinocrinis sp.]|nr:lipid II flippase MurJ [Actinocrinis sp.]